jgi:hypothetical protein
VLRTGLRIAASQYQMELKARCTQARCRPAPSPPAPLPLPYPSSVVCEISLMSSFACWRADISGGFSCLRDISIDVVQFVLFRLLNVALFFSAYRARLPCTPTTISTVSAAPCLPRTSIGIPVTLFSCFSRQVQKRTILLDDARNLSLFLHFPRRVQNGGQLQHGRTLAFTQPGKQHDLPAR